jgi:hypothetical protein
MSVSAARGSMFVPIAGLSECAIARGGATWSCATRPSGASTGDRSSCTPARIVDDVMGETTTFPFDLPPPAPPHDTSNDTNAS